MQIQRLIKSLYPPICLLCGAVGEHHKNSIGDIRDLCNGCYCDLPFNRVACQCCGLPLSAKEAAKLSCGQCQRKPPAFDKAVIPFLYHSPMDYLIKALKFQQHLTIAPLLAGLLGDALAGDDLPEAIIPVPLHSRRLRERGFNQALELAEPMAQRFGLPVLTRIVRRTRHTLPQTDLSFSARATNLRNAFAISDTMTYRHIAIVDDVVTTGNTVNEIAQMLRSAGVERIQIWACARTVG